MITYKRRRAMLIEQPAKRSAHQKKETKPNLIQSTGNNDKIRRLQITSLKCQLFLSFLILLLSLALT